MATEEPSWDEVLETLFQHPTAYPYPFGRGPLGYLAEQSDVALRKWSWPRLRDQAVAVDEVFAEYKGRYLALREARRLLGDVPALVEQQFRTVQSLRNIQVQQQRLRQLLDACPQPRRGAGQH